MTTTAAEPAGPATATEPVRPDRPTIVSVAFWLQLGLAGVLLAVAGLAIAAAVQFDGQITRAAEIVSGADPDEVSGERVGNVLTAVLLAVPALFLAVWFAATARPLRRGGNTARTLVYVGAGLQLLLLCGQGCLGLFLLPFSGGGDWTEAEDGELVWEESEFSETLYGDVDLGTELLGVGSFGGLLLVFALSLAVVLLVSVPPANRYFVPRTEQPAVPPPVAWSYLAAPPPAYATPSGYPVPPGYPTLPSGYPAVPPTGYPVPPGYPVVPPGYLICPDPARHLPPSESAQAERPDPDPADRPTPPTTPGS
ncbi:hypothetical protein [Micromonospora cathayae]|uniref:Uncharacterized protein n=1 Tax=Micromonospora cathayae TaxID=3028804 RepID=A0ABY7ZSX0_9ACTN|nr:hypothetical protein [Micromonospora sp. HUAS 3]WDZ86136.1 hypothetical protein PVK37_06870 [Micromonospora sp. HUAS 3]